MASRNCKHVRANGNLCGSPALKNDSFCYFHAAQRERRLRIQAAEGWTKPFQLPLLEDANAVQIAIMDLANAYLADRIEHKKAALVFKALQSAVSNARRLSFGSYSRTFTEYDTEDYSDHDNTWAESNAYAETEEESTDSNTPAASEVPAPVPTPDLPPRLDAASETCDSGSAQQGEFGGVTVG